MKELRKTLRMFRIAWLGFVLGFWNSRATRRALQYGLAMQRLNAAAESLKAYLKENITNGVTLNITYAPGCIVPIVEIVEHGRDE